MGEDVPGLLADFGGGTPYISVAVHHALLTLASGPAGPEGAYHCLADQSHLDTLLTQALADRDPRQLQALATLEAAAHGRTFLGAVHTAVAQLFNDPAARLPGELIRQLATLAAQVEPADRNHAAAQLTALVASTQETSPSPSFYTWLCPQPTAKSCPIRLETVAK